ncbi:AMP nucleosidase [Corynebacterium uropygiale]|uniref:AMP nucleosidase n=1 Tax=Corynebacterium uropygiale TaxID=1775911 RepID=A0A9X1QSR0_9CORY|nr:AMP nucleosidase [Corynebacterium uropygiale]MCF4007712.1 AMP nucleosidase [Corynebacterium uropygiale]
MVGAANKAVQESVEKLCAIYDNSVATARRAVEQQEWGLWSQVVYPRLHVEVLEWRPIDRAAPFGYVEEAGHYSAEISRPHIMRPYLEEQLTHLTSNYPCRIWVEPGATRIPPEYLPGIGSVGEVRPAGVPRPSLDDVHDAIVDADWDAFHGSEKPLFYFGPQRFDIACARIEHYTGIEVESLQRFILFTNYDMHTTEFEKLGRARLAEEGTRYTGITTAVAGHQMPRIDLTTEDGDGITMINIGVGPSNAKTITDALAVLRPEAWIMIGHCAGLDGRMRIGDLILGNAYQREDYILDRHVRRDVPIPAIPEVQRALEASVAEVYSADKSLMRTGTVLSTGDRNWEWHTPRELWSWLHGSTAVAVDMESCTLATNGYRYRVPYGTLLSVSDLPLHAVPKLPSQAKAFYSNSKEAHVTCAVRAMETLALHPERLRTRKLRRSIGEVPFR